MVYREFTETFDTAEESGTIVSNENVELVSVPIET